MAEYKIINGVKYKKCSRNISEECLGWYPATLEYFYKNKSNKTDGLNPYCKKCAIKKQKYHNSKNSENIKIKLKNKKHSKRGIKPPFNYMGNKYYSFEEIQKYFPKTLMFIMIECAEVEWLVAI